MWKIIVGFVVFAALSMYVLFKGGDIDMSGEKHDTGHPPATSTPSADPVQTPASAAK